jgi:lipopolysaccharide biosynthesis regulator YciM
MLHVFPLLLVSLVGATGWLIGRNNPRKKAKQEQQQFSKDYFVGLNYLLNEQPDEAVDVFIRMLEVDKNTVETHMALGSLFRKRGETHRAIRVHQNIIARPNLSKDMRLQALQELARDYLAAGVYDRAERLFLEAAETHGKHRLQSLYYLLDIYEREKDWYAALETAQQLQKIAGMDKNKMIAQYYCEVIEDPRNHFAFDKINAYLADAFAADPHCLRAGLLKAKQEIVAQNTEEAIKIYQQLIKQDPEFVPMILPLLEQAYLQRNDEKGFVDYLYKSLEAIPQPCVIVKIAEKLASWHGVEPAIEFLQQQLPEHPSLPAIEYLVSLQADELSDANTKQQAQLLQRYLHKVNMAKPRYQCKHCGYHGRKMHWQCPSCRRWGDVKPSNGE